MMVSFFVAILLTTAQLQPSSSLGEPYVFDMTDGTFLYALAHKSDVERTLDRKSDVGNVSRVRIEVWIDEPWKRSLEKQTILGKEFDDATREDSGTYKRRIETAWKAEGGVLIETGSGKSWVLGSERDLAQRSIDMSTPEIMTQAAPVLDRNEVQQRAPVGFVAQWWMHGAIGLGMLVLISVVLWWGFLKKSWSSV